MPIENKNPNGTDHHRAKSEDFFRTMQLAATDTEYRMSAALLAVHSAISLGDAISTAVVGKSGRFDDHKHAARVLNKICGTYKVDSAGVTHLIWLLQNKTDIAYGDRRLDESFTQLAVLKAQRFNAWAYNIFKEVLRVQD